MSEWEHNGRDDSDWYAVVYDSEKDTLYRVETGTTRFANALHCGPPMENPTPEIMEKAKAANLKIALPGLLSYELRRVMEPYADLVKGTKVRLLSECRIMEKTHSSCQKCSGSGFWVNPRNESDKRTCFACSGSGQVTGGKAKDENGKQKWIKLSQGMVGEVLDTQVWGTFYRNGYNRPCRENTRVLIKFDDGSTHWVSATHVCLNDKIRSEEELVAAWKARGGDVDFYSHWRTSSLSML